MKQNIFKRVEQKYLLSKEEMASFIKDNICYLEKDKFFESHIYNIYFDNENHDLIIQSLEKPLFKEKLRIRSYGIPTEKDIIFFEIKRKYKGIVNKRRICLTKKELEDYMKYHEFPKDNPQIMKEIDYFIQFYHLKPDCFVAYDRFSYYVKGDPNLRITFDHNLRSRKNDLVLEERKEDKFYFPDDTYILEVKSLNALPLWMVNYLSSKKIFPTSISKIGSIYQKEREKVLC